MNEYKNIDFVFIGAGLQSQARLPRYRETIKRACLQGTKALNNGKNASEAACIAVAVLEVIFNIISVALSIFVY